MIVKSQFKPAWWLPNNHLQTICRSLSPCKVAPIDRNERLELPDGDFIDLAWAINDLSLEAPLVVLLHGLGGGVQSSYVASLLQAFNQAGYRAVLMLFRGASYEPNRLPRAYHSGDTADLKYCLQELNRREPKTKKAVVGISLGANVLLKYLGETNERTLIQAAVAVSVPFDLQAVTQRINQGFARVYQANLLQRLRAVFLKKLEIVNTQIPLTAEMLLSIKTLRNFDEKVTVPLHGFKSVERYYEESSSKQYLHGIAIPSLIIHAQDDPFMVPEVLPRADELSPEVILELSQNGGHVGFIAGHIPGRPECWLEQRIPAFLSAYILN